MRIFDAMAEHGHEQLVFCHDRTTGLRAVIAIHDTTLGPALGGCRMWRYATEDDAVTDVLRLSRAMTYKAACAGLNLGGGKAVILADETTRKTEAFLRAFGRFVHSLQGRYITAEDVGTNVHDMDLIALETPHVTGTSGRGSSGDPGPATAFGVWRGMKACAAHVWGDEALGSRTVAIQGVGSVGYRLAEHLRDEGARVIVADIAPDKVERARRHLGCEAVEPDAIYDVDCDIFAPCALGATLNADTIPRLKAQVVAGSANNQLATAEDARRLEGRGILYAPDYVINAGGLINVADELSGYNRDRAYRKIGQIHDTLSRIITLARAEGITTAEAADRVAEERIALLGELKKKYLPGRA